MFSKQKLSWLFLFGFVLFLSSSSFAQSKQPRSLKQIQEKILDIEGDKYRQWCENAGVPYPPKATVLRVFKKEKETEIWALGGNLKQMKVIKVLPISAMDFQPGPKLEDGDGKTPEGFYTGKFDNYSDYGFIWINLDSIDQLGQVGKGSCFKICIDYPLDIDRERSNTLGIEKPGDAICIHGNEVSIGCVSFTNRNFLPIFAFSRFHSTKQYGPLQVHIFPFRFDKVLSIAKETAGYEHLQTFGKDKLIRFWENLQQGFDLFNEKKLPLRYRFGRCVLKNGTVSPDVVRLRRSLRSKGIDLANINSETFDDELEKAVRSYQRKAGLTVDGIAGPGTFRSLGFEWGSVYLFD